MNLTISVDPEVLKQARIRAIEEGTSVNAVLRERLTLYANGDRPPEEDESKTAALRREAVKSLIKLSRAERPAANPARSTRDEDGNRTWTRDEIHDR